jgi:ABC-type thiamin/hydroxymethylpyrimidine transport system permease subunit
MLARLAERRRRYYFSTRDLVLIAAVSAAGGVLSTYVGYLGNLLNSAFGVPFGAGQFMAGLHVFWFVLARAIVGRTGAGALAGVLKGLVELFTGSTHGLPIVLVSAVEGVLVDLLSLPFARPPVTAMCLAGAVSSASNVLVFQTMYFSGVSWGYVGLMVLFAAISGAVFGGYFTAGVLGVVETAGLLRPTDRSDAGSGPGRRPRPRVGRLAVTLIMAAALVGGAVYYYTQVFEPLPDGPKCSIEGKVARAYEYTPAGFGDEAVTVCAELVGQVTYVPEADYAGVPLAVILERAGADPSATSVRIIASDGYEAIFSVRDIKEHTDVILSRDQETLRVVAPGFEGAFWVRMVSRIRVE